MNIEEILIVRVGEEHFGIVTGDINQIARVPSLMPLPLRPHGSRGLCSVGGSVVSVMDLNMLIGFDNEVDEEGYKSRLISLNGDFSTYALLVDEVDDTVEVDATMLEHFERQKNGVVAIYKHAQILVQVLSLEDLFGKVKKVSIEAQEIKSGDKKQVSVKDENCGRFLIFMMANERYALNIDHLQEIILADEEVTQIPESSEEIEGWITLREELLLILDLSKYYGYKPLREEANRILVVALNNKKIGLLVDRVIDIQNIPLTHLEILSEEKSAQRTIAGVIHDEQGLISYMDESNLEELLSVSEYCIAHSNGVDNDTHIQGEEDIFEVIVFTIDGKEYAFAIDDVDEIINAQAATEVAFSDEKIDGIVNIRGQIVTIVSLYKFLGLQPVMREDARIIICSIHDMRIGFVVESVSDILTIPLENVRDNQEDETFSKVLYLEDGKRLVLLMEIEKIIED